MSNTEANETEGGSKSIRVIAKHNFEGRNNDELSFAKNDVITVTQKLDGGWWEGALADKVGWFPSDFVGIIKTESNGKVNGVRLSTQESDEAFEKTRLKFRHEILLGVDGFMVKESEHIAKLMKFQTDFLPLIHEHHTLSSQEFKTISTNILQIIEAKKALYEKMAIELKKEVPKQEIGALFLEHATNLKDLLLTYCANHPLAMALIVKKREQIEKTLKTKSIDIKEFITGLSLVFRHTEKYSSILQEVERNTSNAHSDRGNLQRACSVYRDIAENCLAIRKQKEMQMEFLNSGFLDKAFGKSYESKLGQLIYILSVTITLPDSNEEDAFDRCFVLFKNSCIFLEVTNEKNMFVLKEQFPVNGLKIQCNDNLMQVAFLKESTTIFTINSLTMDDYRRLCTILRGFPFEEVASNNVYNIHVPSISPQKVETERMTSISPSKQVEFSNLPQSKKAISQNKNQLTKNGNITLNHQIEMILPDGGEVFAQKPPIVPGTNSGTPRAPRSAKLYSGWCLRPFPTARVNNISGLQSTASSSSIKLRKGLTIEEQEDAYLLKIVEGYCAPPSSANGLVGSISRMNVSSSSQHPLPRRATSYPEEMRPQLQLIVANDEKIFVEEMEGNEIVLKEKSLVDTVYELKDQVVNLQKELSTMKQNVVGEQKARRRLEEAFRRLSNNYSHPSTPKPTDESTNA